MIDSESGIKSAVIEGENVDNWYVVDQERRSSVISSKALGTGHGTHLMLNEAIHSMARMSVFRE